MSLLSSYSSISIETLNDSLKSYAELANINPELLDIGILVEAPNHTMGLIIKKAEDGNLSWQFNDPQYRDHFAISINETNKIVRYILETYCQESSSFTKVNIKFVSAKNNSLRYQIRKIIEENQPGVEDVKVVVRSAFVSEDIDLLRHLEKKMIEEELYSCENPLNNYEISLSTMLYLLDEGYNKDLILRLAKEQGQDKLLEKMEQMRLEDKNINGPAGGPKR